MIPYRYALAITSQFYFCGIPFRLDTIPKCPLNCSYCFAMARGGRRTSVDLLANPKQLFRKLERANLLMPQVLDITGEFLMRRVPVHFGGMSDPFANRKVTEISKQLLNILAEFNYPTVISTKNINELQKDDLLNILKKFQNVIIQISLPSFNHKFTKIIEPGIPTPIERLKVLNDLAREGFYTIVRLQPLFPDHVNEVNGDLIPRLGEANVKHVVVEFLKLPVESQISRIFEMFEELNWNGKDFYQSKGAIRTGREWVLPPRLKWEILQPIIESIHSNKMTFGAGDYGLNHLSDTDCCCGIDAVIGFSEWFKPNIPHLIRKSKSYILDISILDSFSIPKKSIRMYMNSHCRAANTFNIYDFLKLKWNRPGTENAPDSFLGVSFKGDYDNDSNCIYIREPL